MLYFSLFWIACVPISISPCSDHHQICEPVEVVSWDLCTEGLRLGGCLWRLTRPRPLLRARSDRAGCSGMCPVLDTFKHGDSKTFLFWHLIILSVRKVVWFCFFHMLKRNFSLCPFPCVLSLGTTENSLASSTLPSPSGIYTPKMPPVRHNKMPPQPFLLEAKQSQRSQPLLLCQILLSLNHLIGPKWPFMSHHLICHLLLH